MRTVLLVSLLGLVAAPARDEWAMQASGTTARLRGLCVVDERVAWASGTGGTVLRTTDGGMTWERRPVAGVEALDFRDIEAFDERTACALSIGEGEQSRIYRTEDGGASWTLRHVNRDAAGFLDALAFWDARHGLALGDPVGGRFAILTTDDGGQTWTRIAPEGLPEALPGEGAFAASGTCLAVGGDRHAWFGTGGGRVFRSADRGRTWTAHETPIRAGNGTSGVFSLAFRDARHGVAVGGDYKEPTIRTRTIALTSDGGLTWRLPSGEGPGGYRSAVAFLGGAGGMKLVAVGPTGADRSDDGGESWAKLGDTGFHAVSVVGSPSAWAVGEEGRIGRLDAGRVAP
jgi:photosystem II stability/assembly factor-like uncharacterized protein